MGFRDLERAIERGVDGVLGKVFRSDVSQLEINKRVQRELDAGARKGERGTRTMPNDIEVRIHPADADRLDYDTAELQRDLLLLAREHARDSECGFEGPLVVRVTARSRSTRPPSSRSTVFRPARSYTPTDTGSIWQAGKMASCLAAIPSRTS